VHHSTDQIADSITATSEQPRRGGAHTIDGACELLGHIGRSTIYGLIAAGQLEAVKLGSRTLITDESIADLLAKLPRLKGRVAVLPKGGDQ
jgi:excisionase family DNA binding protein